MPDGQSMRDRPGAPSGRTRRRLLQGLLATGGGLLGVPALALLTGRVNRAWGDEHGGQGNGDESGKGGCRGSGHGDEDAGGSAVAGTGMPTGSTVVRIVDDNAQGFTPARVTVDPGQPVTFVNADHHTHTATSSAFDTGRMPPGATAAVVLTTPGRFAYACQIHPVMTGEIAVRGPDGAVPTSAPAATPTTTVVPVRIANFAFDPAAVTLPVGGGVIWTNTDPVPHTVTALDGSFDAGIVAPGATVRWTFAHAGAIHYHCALHPQMQGTVTVTAAGASHAQPAASPRAEPATPDASPAPPQGTPAAKGTPGAARTVTIHDFAFAPATLRLPVGATVVWVNQGQAPHTATADANAFDTGLIAPGQSARHVFDRAGAFAYHCNVHPTMHGQIVVG
jgi:plastocyanin